MSTNAGYIYKSSSSTNSTSYVTQNHSTSSSLVPSSNSVGFRYGGQLSSNPSTSATANLSSYVISSHSLILDKDKKRKYDSESTHSNQLISREIQGGVLSTKQEKEQFENVNRTTEAVSAQVIENINKINKVVDDYNNNVSGALKKFTGFIFSAMDKAQNGTLSEQDVGNVKFLQDATQMIREEYDTSAKRYLQLIQAGSSTISENCKKNIDLIVYARLEQLKILSLKIDILQKQELHEVKNATELHELRLREQNQLFQQLMQYAESESKETEASHQRDLATRKQEHAEKTDNRRLDLEEKKIDNEAELERIKEHNNNKIRRLEINNNHEVAKTKIQIESDIEKYKATLQKEVEKERSDVEKYKATLQKEVDKERIEADRDARTTEAIANAAGAAAGPKCLVM